MTPQEVKAKLTAILSADARVTIASWVRREGDSLHPEYIQGINGWSAKKGLTTNDKPVIRFPYWSLSNKGA